MDLQQVAMTEFVLLQASWPVEKSRQLVEQLKPSHVIVHRREARNEYYLLTAEEALNLLKNATNASSVGKAPSPTRVEYAFITPITRSIRCGGTPVPVHAPPAVVLEEVTYG